MSRTVPLTVVLPIGPAEHHCRWLGECLESIRNQDVLPAEMLLIDDMHDLRQHCPEKLIKGRVPWYQHVWRAPWRLGNGTAVNIGISLAANEAVLIMAGDDRLLDGAVQAAWLAYERAEHRDALYYFGVRFSNGEPDQQLPWGGAMVTKGLWKLTGGYAPNMHFGDGDAALCSILLKHMPDRLIPVSLAEPLYWHRKHAESNTGTRDAWWGVMLEARRLVTDQWQAPVWGRYV